MEYEDRYQKPKYDCLLFDLDDTLYPRNAGLAEECTKNIRDYMIERLGIEDSKVTELGNLLYKNYGTTMAGLRAIGYNFNYDEYHRFVHGRLPYENLKPDPILRHLLLSAPLRKVIFTNADGIHAAKALSRLGLEDCFEGIICFETLNSTCSSNDCTNIFDIAGHFARGGDAQDLPKTPVLCKPSLESIEEALRIADIDPRRTIFFEDSVRNVQSGKATGMRTVIVGTSHRVKGADHSLESIHNIKEALPELWDGAEKKLEEVSYSLKMFETSVVA